MLTYRKSNHLEVIGYSDSDFAGCVDIRKSTFGYTFLLKEKSHGKVQSNLLLLHLLWKLSLWHALRPQFRKIGCGSRFGVVDSIAKSLKIYCDNFATVFFSKKDKYFKGSKHMELKYFAFKKEVHKQRVSVEHISTNLMIVDLLTKGLPPKTFTGHVERMGIIEHHY